MTYVHFQTTLLGVMARLGWRLYSKCSNTDFKEIFEEQMLPEDFRKTIQTGCQGSTLTDGKAYWVFESFFCLC